VTQEEIDEGSIELSMVMLIDTLAERYGLLPSEVLHRANTFDVFVADTAIGYRNTLTDRAVNPNKLPEYKEQDLMEILKNG
jgi:hypothetical protein